MIWSAATQSLLEFGQLGELGELGHKRYSLVMVWLAEEGSLVFLPSSLLA